MLVVRAVRGRRRGLHLREGIDLVVEDQHDRVDVVPDRMQPVVAADAEAVPVAHDRDHGELGTREAHAGGDRESAAVDSVEPVGLEVVGEAARTSDARHRDDVLRLEVVLPQHALKGRQHAVVATALTPARHLGFVLVEGVLFDRTDFEKALLCKRGYHPLTPLVAAGVSVRLCFTR